MQNYPQKKGIDFILKLAFSYWSRTLLYQVVFSVLFLSVMFLVATYFMNEYGILEQYTAVYQKFIQNQDMAEYQKNLNALGEKPEFQRLFWILFGTSVFLYPLNLGLFKIFRKLDLNEKPEITDMFAGYSGINFFIYISFYLFWLIIYLYSAPTIILAVIWIFITLFSAPLMFFMDKRIFETISLSVKGLRLYFIEIVVCMLVAILFKYIGIFTLVGALFTFPFVNAMIYALYQVVFAEKTEKV